MKLTEKEYMELKNEIDRLSMLIKRLNRKENTNGMNNLPKSEEMINYMNEVEEKEKPYLYYHAQNLLYAIEIRKYNKEYAVTTNFKCKLKLMEDGTRLENKTYGGNIRMMYVNEDFDSTKKNFLKAIECMIEATRKINELDLFN